MPRSRFQHQQSPLNERQISISLQNTTRRSARLRNAGIFTTAIIAGGVIGYFSLPSDSGGRFVSLFVGSASLVFLVFWVKAGIADVRNGHISGPSLLSWSVALPIAAMFGAIPGYNLRPGTVFGVLLGAIIVPVGVIVLIGLIQGIAADFTTDPLGSLMDLLGEGCLGCFLPLSVLFIMLVGTISGLLVGHTLLLGVLTF